jgi:predicted enzyme related to lactoylglutathione lyase
MSTRTDPWPQGTPSWVDLGTTDPAAAAEFYSALFGWDLIDTGPETGNYRICLKNGLPAAGIGGQTPGGPDLPTWTTYLAVDDADASAAAIAANGGVLVMPVMDVADQGRMAIALDPNGAAFGIWQAVQMPGAQIVNEPGGLVWNENVSHDPVTARKFYAAVFGYDYTPIEGDEDYATINGAGPGNTVGGIGAFGAEMPAETPAQWRTYFMVEDADSAAQTTVSRGGQVPMGPMDTPFGRMAAIQDPQGGVVWVMGEMSGGSAES